MIYIWVSLSLCDYLRTLKINIIYAKVILKVNKLANIFPESEYMSLFNKCKEKSNNHPDLQTYILLPFPRREIAIDEGSPPPYKSN